MRHEHSEKPEQCPECGSDRVADILRGMPAFTEQLQKDMEAGRVVLGGCVIGEDDPEWRCADCDAELYKKRPNHES